MFVLVLLEKFDGRYNRNLAPNEIGQIAGRAGRYKNNGSFSYTKEAGNLDPLIIKNWKIIIMIKCAKNLLEEFKFDFKSVEIIVIIIKTISNTQFFYS